jgi:hypothetical protein
MNKITLNKHNYVVSVKWTILKSKLSENVFIFEIGVNIWIFIVWLKKFDLNDN